jgi:hypothetical protein
MAAAALYAGAKPDVVLAARTIVFEDFEDETPGDSARAGQIESLDLYVRSSVTGPSDPSDALISGGQFPDPFAPGNKSLILYNPEATTQQATNFYDFFDGDPTLFRNGVIEFDLYMEMAEPDSYWTFLDIRFGFDTEGPRTVGTVGDVTIWNTIRMQEGGVQGGGTAPNILYDYRTQDTYADPNVVAPERKFHVRYDINGGAVGNPSPTYSVSIDNLENPDAPVVVTWPGGMAKPWFEFFNFETFMNEPAPGINVISFLTDASANGLSDSSQNTYIDNLRVINNDLPPLEEDADFDADGYVDGADFLTWQRGVGISEGATVAQGDANGDMAVNAADLAVFRMQFGQTGGMAPVPEPVTTALALVASLGAVASRRRSSGGVCHSRE